MRNRKLGLEGRHGGAGQSPAFLHRTSQQWSLLLWRFLPFGWVVHRLEKGGCRQLFCLVWDSPGGGVLMSSRILPGQIGCGTQASQRKPLSRWAHSSNDFQSPGLEIYLSFWGACVTGYPAPRVYGCLPDLHSWGRCGFPGCLASGTGKTEDSFLFP